MNSENPYEAPKADSSVSEPFAPENRGPTLGLASVLFSFHGRVPRSVYWGVSIAVGLVFYGTMFVLVAAFGEDSSIAMMALLALYALMIWINLAIQVKRWHDRDKSGWWILIGVIPIVGPIWSFVETGCLRGTFGPNRYGPDPIAAVGGCEEYERLSVPRREECPWCQEQVVPTSDGECSACHRPI
jgi:uncharacterized membrane protein YhaH (DUF805 family)